MQRFSWTLEGLPRAIAAREAERRQAAEAEGPALLRLLSGGRRLLLRLSPAPPSPAAEKGQEQHPQQSQPQQHQSFSLEGSNAERLEQRRCEREQEQLSALQRSDAGGLQQPAAQPAHPGPSRGVSAPLAAAPAPHDSRSTLGSRSVLRALSRRASALLHPHHHEHRQGHDVPPMFCFELAVRLFYWTKLAYRYWVSPALLPLSREAPCTQTLSHASCAVCPPESAWLTAPRCCLSLRPLGPAAMTPEGTRLSHP
jgi:hypothetical protein